MRSPLTGMIFTLELTHDFNAMPVLLIGCVTALAVTVLVLRRSILTEKLARRGQHITREYSVDLFELMRVGEVMDRKVPTIPADWTVLAFSERMAQGDLNGARHAAFIVDVQEKLAGIITRSDALRALRFDPAGTITVLAAGQTHLIVTFPDEPLCDAIAKMLKHKLGRLPVVEREDHRQVVGYLGRADILAVRLRHHEEEESRSRGPLWAGAVVEWRR
jgi:CBS domain-containing protein